VRNKINTVRQKCVRITLKILTDLKFSPSVNFWCSCGDNFSEN